MERLPKRLAGSPEILERLVAQGLADGLFPGATWIIWREGKGVLARGCAGRLDDRGGGAIDPSTLWDLASITKPMVTATLVMILTEEGLLHPDDSLQRFLPNYPSLAGITLRHCLSHTSGLRAWERLFDVTGGSDCVGEAVRRSERERPSGAGYTYSDLGFILVGQSLEAAAGEKLDRLASRLIFDPLGMRDTGYCPSASSRARAAPTWCHERETYLTGEVHDANCAALGGIAGHAGVFSTAGDLHRYGSALLQGGALEGSRILTAAGVAAMLANQNAPGMNGHTLGWFARPSGYLPAGDLLPQDTVGHTGFTGTSLLLAPSCSAGILLLTNRVYFNRDAGEFLRWRRLFHGAAATLLD